jgi:Zn-dependent peptidase ImmA (M78 family)/transcriptional regulator with XRE-family HTH domain
MEKTKFQPERLTLIRCVHGISQTDLSNDLGVSRQFVNQVERQGKTLTDENIDQLSLRFDVHRDFFFRAAPRWIDRAECNFRKFKTTTQSFENQVIAKATLLSESLGWIGEHIHFPAVNIPRLNNIQSDRDIETAAAACRAQWGLGDDAPIDNMTRVLENAGVVCLNISGIDRKISALSIAGNLPLLLHNVEFSQPTRYRFDLAHELGHFVIHRGKPTGDEVTEKQADRFASSFLMPAKAFAKEFPLRAGDRIDWTALAAVKRRWGVSFKAIVRRAFELGLLFARQYRSAHIFLNSRGYAKREPFEPEHCESPEIVDISLRALSTELGIFGEDICCALGVRHTLLSSLLGNELPLRTLRRAQVINFPSTQKEDETAES